MKLTRQETTWLEKALDNYAIQLEDELYDISDDMCISRENLVESIRIFGMIKKLRLAIFHAKLDTGPDEDIEI